MKRNQGFTLIELIIVIVILGVLAVTAAPRFLDFSGDARTSTLNGVRGALESAGALVYGRAIIAGVQNDDAVAVADSPVAGVALVNGYPAADDASLRGATELVAAEWDMAVSTANNAPGFGAVGTTSVVISPVGTNLATTEADSCHVVYVQSTGDGIKPVITVYADGC